MNKIDIVVDIINKWTIYNGYTGQFYTRCIMDNRNGLFITFLDSETGYTVTESWADSFINRLDINTIDLYLLKILSKLDDEHYKNLYKLKNREIVITKILNNVG